ncbi:MAG: hypothetical protein CML89_05130 [Rhodobiaceae bacterium]|nr:hypothetical protein [Rhodobiaceae bacterium]
MLTHFKSILITSGNIEESHEQFHKLFGHDTSDIGNDSDLKIYSHNLKNGSIELCENKNQEDIFYYSQLKKHNLDNGIQALSIVSDDIFEDHRKFKEMNLNISDIEEIDFNFRNKKNIKSRFFSLKKTNPSDLNLLVFDQDTALNDKGNYEDDTISKFNQIIIYTPDIEHLRDLFTEKLGIRLALDKVFNFGEKDIRMMFFRIGGVTLEVIENPDSESLSYGGIGWHSENISKCHKRLIDSNFELSEIRKGRKPGTIVATIRNAPLKMPTIIIGLDD